MRHRRRDPRTPSDETQEYTRTVFDHVAINVRDMDASRVFFEAALAPIGYEVSFESADWVGMRAGDRNDFGLVRRDPVGATVHIAFEAPDRAAVDAFHAAGDPLRLWRRLLRRFRDRP
jgi:catechol 2,3-dioxygenase-like lactoylglutathione lyase family enzyme